MDREYSGTDGQYKQRDEHPKEEPKKYYRSKKKKMTEIKKMPLMSSLID